MSFCLFLVRHAIVCISILHLTDVALARRYFQIHIPVRRQPERRAHFFGGFRVEVLTWGADLEDQPVSGNTISKTNLSAIRPPTPTDYTAT